MAKKKMKLSDRINKLMDIPIVLIIVFTMGAWGMIVGYITGYFHGCGDKQKAFDAGYYQAINTKIDFTNLRKK